jgi:hypothetical protein
LAEVRQGQKFGINQVSNTEIPHSSNALLEGAKEKYF